MQTRELIEVAIRDTQAEVKRLEQLLGEAREKYKIAAITLEAKRLESPRIDDSELTNLFNEAATIKSDMSKASAQLKRLTALSKKYASDADFREQLEETLSQIDY
jgi:hypothetical protein